MEKSEANGQEIRRPRRFKAWHVILLVVLLIVVVISGVVYSKWGRISSAVTSHPANGNPGQANLQLPPGFQAEIFYSGLSAPRFITFSPDGTLFVAERGRNSIVVLPDPQHTGKATERVVVADDLDQPTSLDFHQGALYVGEATKVTRLTLTKDYKVSEKKVIVSNLPTGGHSTRTVLIGSDGKLYVSIGSSCNVCIESDTKRASIWQYNLDGSNGRLYAKGLRNAVGMTINPWTQQTWVTNNGRDLLGDDTPPETVYSLQDGGNYGWPFCHAGDITDPDFGNTDSCKGVIKPKVRMQAHSAPLGLAFYNKSQFPAQYRGLFVAFHGSWNRSVPTGYKVVFIPTNDKGQVSGSLQDFATGWLKGTNTSGRPVGLTVGPDGALYISDDTGGFIYRVTYKG